MYLFIKFLLLLFFVLFLSMVQVCDFVVVGVVVFCLFFVFVFVSGSSVWFLYPFVLLMMSADCDVRQITYVRLVINFRKQERNIPLIYIWGSEQVSATPSSPTPPPQPPQVLVKEKKTKEKKCVICLYFELEILKQNH